MSDKQTEPSVESNTLQGITHPCTKEKDANAFFSAVTSPVSHMEFP